jgi:hypothetical protein
MLQVSTLLLEVVNNLPNSTVVTAIIITAIYSKLDNIPKGLYYSGIKIYSHLPTVIKDLSENKNKFKQALKRCLLHYSFYSMEEYFNT